MKPFNLKRALAGDPVVTRDGERAKIIIDQKINGNHETIVAVFNQCIELYYDEGKYYADGREDDNDLLMDNIEQDEIDNVNHPAHYTNSPAKCSCGKSIECIEVTRHLNFNIGNAIKYLWRCDHKNNALEDLKKAAWYIQDEINKRSQDK